MWAAATCVRVAALRVALQLLPLTQLLVFQSPRHLRLSLVLLPQLLLLLLLLPPPLPQLLLQLVLLLLLALLSEPLLSLVLLKFLNSDDSSELAIAALARR